MSKPVGDPNAKTPAPVKSVPTAAPDSELTARAKSLGIPVLAEAPRKIEKAILNFIPEDAARKYRMVVYEKTPEAIRVAMVDPEDFDAFNFLRFLAEKEQLVIEVSITSSETLEELLKQYTGTDRALKEAITALKSGGVEAVGVAVGTIGSGKGAAPSDVLQDAPIARLVDAIVKHAVEGRASDIHVEPSDGNYRVRFRIDGILHASLIFPGSVGKAVVARIKILSNLKIDEQRKPQDGRFRAQQSGKIVDLRISTFPVVDGEKVVMRVLDKGDTIVDFKRLGLWGRNSDILRRKIMEPFGIILITGPTGSGKSTTLYAFLQILNLEERNIVTLEDPVEYSVPGINQSQVKPEIGYTFATGLRSILRQDPNVIMVGEIRDSETAELAIHAALTGHLVLSTLHTNDAIGAIPRLVDMKIEPFLLAASIQVVAAQRLVRRICPDCKREDKLSVKTAERIRSIISPITPAEFKQYGYDSNTPIKTYRGAGCKSCGESGYKGRIAIYECFEVNDEVRRIITDERANEGLLRKESERQGMLSMHQDGLVKSLMGLTTLSEVERVTEGGVMVDEE